MTVFCMVELDGGTVIDASLRALTLARGLAVGADDGPVLAAVVFGDPPEGARQVAVHLGWDRQRGRNRLRRIAADHDGQRHFLASLLKTGPMPCQVSLPGVENCQAVTIK